MSTSTMKSIEEWMSTDMWESDGSLTREDAYKLVRGLIEKNYPSSMGCERGGLYCAFEIVELGTFRVFLTGDKYNTQPYWEIINN